jgi:tyrosine-protein phosphatase YwqE
MSLFSIFKKKASSPIALSRLAVDIHSHLLPGIDDGAKTLEHSIAMIQKFVALGYKKLITTPHIMSDAYPNTPESIRNALHLVRNELNRLHIDIQIEAAAEYYADDYFFQLIDEEPLLTFADNHVLFEFSFHEPPMNAHELVFKLIGKNYKPMLAHYERYNYYHSIKEAEAFREKGAFIQVNINSLTGHYGPQAKKIAEQLIDAKLVDLLGTDCHRIEHLMLLENNLSKAYFHKMLDLDLLNYKV